MRTRTIARWRRAALAGMLAGSLTLPARAQVQQKTDAGTPQQAPAKQPAAQAAPAPAQQTEPEGPSGPAAVGENAPVPARPATPVEGAPQPVPGSPDEYTIQKGDTLWDLSQKFLANPWYWPKIWSLNPAIENPHWIYPGNKLRIVPGEGGAQAPAQVEAEQAPVEPAEVADQPLPPAQGGASVAVGNPNTPDLDVVTRKSPESRGSSSVSVTGKLAFTPPPVVTVRASGLVSPEELAASGSIDASFEERQMLSTFDTAYVQFPKNVQVKTGDQLLLFRDDGEITHPVSHRKLANKTKNVGIVRVLGMKGALVTVQVEQVFEEIERGDRVRPYVSPTVRIAPQPNTRDVSGVVVSEVNQGLSTYGEANQVFIDKGTADGVQDGNTFAVVRHGDGLNNKLVTGHTETAGEQGVRAARVATPDENVGLLLVVETKEHLSLAIVVKSIRELQAGDQVEMHASGAGGGGF